MISFSVVYCKSKPFIISLRFVDCHQILMFIDLPTWEVLKMGNPQVTMVVSMPSHDHPWLGWCTEGTPMMFPLFSNFSRLFQIFPTKKPFLGRFPHVFSHVFPPCSTFSTPLLAQQLRGHLGTTGTVPPRAWRPGGRCGGHGGNPHWWLVCKGKKSHL